MIFHVILASGLGMMTFAMVHNFASALCQIVLLGALYNVGRILIDVDIQRTVTPPSLGGRRGQSKPLQRGLDWLCTV